MIHTVQILLSIFALSGVVTFISMMLVDNSGKILAALTQSSWAELATSSQKSDRKIRGPIRLRSPSRLQLGVAKPS